jgi:uncharacterized protein (DUF433 family)/GNAT superfamily N-acetyltransferase
MRLIEHDSFYQLLCLRLSLTLYRMELTGIGLYTLQQASRLSGAKASEVSRWLFGYKAGEGKQFPPLWQPQVRDVEEKVIGFQDLMELRIVKAFSGHGVPTQLIRMALRHAKEIFGSEYPFTSNRFLTDGRTIFYETLEQGRDELTDLVRRQLVFESIIRPQLYEGIEFSSQGAAVRWFPRKGKTIMLDPDVSFGRPVLSAFGIPTEVIAQAMKAERNVRAVAAQFEIPVDKVRAAVKFEEQLLAA